MYSQDKWDKIYSKGYLASYPNSEVVSFVFKNFGKNNPLRAAIKILDLGCGGGQ